MINIVLILVLITGITSSSLVLDLVLLLVLCFDGDYIAGTYVPFLRCPVLVLVLVELHGANDDVQNSSTAQC